jgi:hypothetical protein
LPNSRRNIGWRRTESVRHASWVAVRTQNGQTLRTYRYPGKAPFFAVLSLRPRSKTQQHRSNGRANKHRFPKKHRS